MATFNRSVSRELLGEEKLEKMGVNEGGGEAGEVVTAGRKRLQREREGRGDG